MSKKFTIEITTDDIEGAKSALFTASELINLEKSVEFLGEGSLRYYMTIKVEDLRP